MRKRPAFTALTVLITAFSAGVLFAAGSLDDIAAHRTCASCGMDRKAYGYSRMLIKYVDGSETGVCSLHCYTAELTRQPGRAAKESLVADRDSHALLPVEQAFWVAGGSKRGVMSRHPAWAFQTAASADAFIAAYGGARSAWTDVLFAAKEEAAGGKR